MKEKNNPMFRINGAELQIDMVFVDYIYPVLFTCTDKNNRLYIAACYWADAERKEWIIAKTSPAQVISLLQNKVTIRDMFLQPTLWQAKIGKGESLPSVFAVNPEMLDESILPTADQYLDAEPGEFSIEIQQLSHRKENIYGDLIRLAKTEYYRKTAPIQIILCSYFIDNPNGSNCFDKETSIRGEPKCFSMKVQQSVI